MPRACEVARTVGADGFMMKERGGMHGSGKDSKFPNRTRVQAKLTSPCSHKLRWGVTVPSFSPQGGGARVHASTGTTAGPGATFRQKACRCFQKNISGLCSSAHPEALAGPLCSVSCSFCRVLLACYRGLPTTGRQVCHGSDSARGRAPVSKELHYWAFPW